MANGRVAVGFSAPVVGLYSAAGGTVTYTAGKGMRLARGVSVALNLQLADNNDFYADNVRAESEGGTFTGGTATLTVDGLLPAAERFVMGLPEPTEVSYGATQKVMVDKYGDNVNAPYVGVGYVVEYLSGGVHTWEPTILRKGKFQQPTTEASTKGETTDYQTQALTVDLSRDDTATHDWKWVGEAQTSEAAAIAILEGLLGVGEG